MKFLYPPWASLIREPNFDMYHGVGRQCASERHKELMGSHDIPIILGLPSPDGPRRFKHFRCTLTRGHHLEPGVSPLILPSTFCAEIDNMALERLSRRRKSTITPEQTRHDNAETVKIQ
jgi:hypothetical protein